MGTAKRERQKANRQLRIEAMQVEQRKKKTRKKAISIGAFVVAIVAVAIVLSLTIGKDDDTTTSATSVPSATTVPGSTTATTIPFAYGTTECPAADGSSAKTTTFTAPFKQCIDPAKTYTATVETNKGVFTVALDAKKAPGTVNNFVALARFHYFDDNTCHRVIENFVVQCGDPTGTGTGGPGYTIPDELPAQGEYQLGSIVMANTGTANTGGGQFFIVTGDKGVQLPPSYALFGQVSDGFDSTVKALAALADPNANNGVPTKEPITITKVTITES